MCVHGCALCACVQMSMNGRHTQPLELELSGYELPDVGVVNPLVHLPSRCTLLTAAPSPTL